MQLLCSGRHPDHVNSHELIYLPPQHEAALTKVNGAPGTARPSRTPWVQPHTFLRWSSERLLRWTPHFKRHRDQTHRMVRRCNQHDSWLIPSKLLGCAGEDTLNLKDPWHQYPYRSFLWIPSISSQKKTFSLEVKTSAWGSGSGSWKGRWESLGSVFRVSSYPFFGPHLSHQPCAVPSLGLTDSVFWRDKSQSSSVEGHEDFLVVWSKEGTGAAIILFLNSN